MIIYSAYMYFNGPHMPTYIYIYIDGKVLK